MARWRLTQPHYLNVLVDGEPTQWEYKEVNRVSGKAARKVFNVPLHLNPNEPSDQNYPGEVIVAQGKGILPKDIVFTGEPTPDMEPLDEEAEAISEKCRPRWKHPIDSLSAEGGYAGNLFQDFQKQLADLLANRPAQAAAPVTTQGVDPAEFKKMQEQLAMLMARNAELEAKAEAKPGRRVA